MQPPGPLLSPNLKKEKNLTRKKILVFQEMELSSPPPPKKKKKNLIKLSYSLNKTPLEQTGCLSKLCYLLAAQASRIHFQNHSFKNTCG